MPTFTVLHYVSNENLFRNIREPRCFADYNQVGEVEARDLEDAYALTQGIYDDDKSFTIRNRCRSLSVGDVLFDQSTSTYYGVDSFGFIELATVEHAVLGAVGVQPTE